MQSFVIAVDGPAASGKGTLNRALGARLGFDVLETGLLYRAVARQLLDLGLLPTDEKASTRVAQNLTPKDLERDDLRSEAVGQAASLCSGHPSVRATLLQFQVDFANNPPGGRGAILDGRDIGTVVCPNATVKLWITASPEVRAQRRFDESLAKGDTSQSVAEIAASIAARDERERTRSVSPMVPAHDAWVLDTSSLGAAEVLNLVLAKVEPMKAHHDEQCALEKAIEGVKVPQRRRELR